MTLKGYNSWVIDDHLTELSLLAETAGADVIEVLSQRRDNIDPAYYIGKGKCSALKNLVVEINADLVIFDDDLSPAQVRNLQREINRRVVDRTGIILDIFARRARSREAKIEVELAQLNYLLPRLTRHWEHLSRQAGGIGTRGPGETQLETDRRLVRERIAVLRMKLKRIERGRSTRRRRRKELPVVALVGYTNAGKSTLLNSLTNADVFVEDKLFATLDPVVRSYQDDKGRKVLFTDTVGFIRKLPHHLVASFKSTLEEVVEADLLLHIVDIAHPFYLNQMEEVRQVLGDIGAGGRPILTVFNKVDLVSRDSSLQAAKDRHPGALFISAIRRIGLKRLMETVLELVFTPTVSGEITLEPAAAAEWESKFKSVRVESKKFVEGKIKIRFSGDGKMRDLLLRFAEGNNLLLDE